jgi:hypothetical protein
VLLLTELKYLAIGLPLLSVAVEGLCGFEGRIDVLPGRLIFEEKVNKGSSGIVAFDMAKNPSLKPGKIIEDRNLSGLGFTSNSTFVVEYELGQSIQRVDLSLHLVPINELFLFDSLLFILIFQFRIVQLVGEFL